MYIEQVGVSQERSSCREIFISCALYDLFLNVIITVLVYAVRFFSSEMDVRKLCQIQVCWSRLAQPIRPYCL
jgi:hypothetical protein